MPSRLAIRAVENTQDPGDSMAPQKGNIVRVAPAKWQFGTKVVLPNWIRVAISDLTYKQARQYNMPWMRTPQLEVVLSDLALDRFRLKIVGEAPDLAGVGGFPQARVQAFLDAWDLTPVSTDNNSVTFDLDVKVAGFSSGFWGGLNVGNMVFAQTSYNQGTGRHIVTADYSATSYDANTAAHVVKKRATDVLDNDGGVVTYELDRMDVRAAFLEDVHDRLSVMVGRTRYHVTEAAVDAVVGAGGTGSFTEAQFLGVLQDRADG